MRFLSHPGTFLNFFLSEHSPGGGCAAGAPLGRRAKGILIRKERR